MTHDHSMSEQPRRTQWNGIPLTSVCNDTKWERLRTSVLQLEGGRPSFRTKDLNGYYAQPDSEWHHHFRLGGYETTRFVDIFCHDTKQSEQVLKILHDNDLSGHAIDGGYRVYGYTEHGDQIAKF